MESIICIYGIVDNDPTYIPPHTVFQLRCGEKHYTVLRGEPLWQKRDVVFLRRGQWAEVWGSPFPNGKTVLADRIRIGKILPEEKFLKK